MSAVSENIKKIIETKGLKKKAVAKAAGYTVSKFSNMLNGRQNIQAQDIKNISIALGVTPNDLF